MRDTSEVMYKLWKKHNWTQRQIADLFGCNVATICRKIEPERWTRWQIVISKNKLKKLYEDLGSIKKVADALWCSTGTVYKYLKQYEIPINRPCVHLSISCERMEKGEKDDNN